MHSPKLIALNFAFPLSVAFLFVLFNVYQVSFPSYLLSVSPYLFYLLSILVLAISWHFNRINFIFVVLPLLLFYMSISFVGKDTFTYLFHIFSIVYPLHLLLFVHLKERGLFTFWGNIKISFFVFELVFIAIYVKFFSQSVVDMYSLKIFAFNLSPLSDISFLVFLLVFFVMLSVTLFAHLLIYNTSFVIILISFYVGLGFIKHLYALEHSFIVITLIILVLLVREAYRLAFHDELTTLPGRRALIEDMAKLGRKYSLAMIDIDHFKKFNDTHGHDTGDEVLKMVASKLAEVGAGKAYRYGGEEFTILFPSMEKEESYIHTDIVRQKIAASEFIVRGKDKNKKIFINISAGVVQNIPQDNNPFDTMKRADQALYKAKEAGRNTVIKA